MSITIRLAKVGRRNAPAFKIVVANTKDKREGKFLDVLGYYNPSLKSTPSKTDEFGMNMEKFEAWVKKGALVTQAVSDLKDGIYTFKPYDNKKGTKAEASASPAAEKASEASGGDATEDAAESQE